MRRTTKIAVIGAGLGGMTVAGLLQRSGFVVKVYEQASAFSRIGAGIHLSSNVMLVMRRLGIEQALCDIGLHPDAFVSRQWDTGEKGRAKRNHHGLYFLRIESNRGI